MNNKTKTMEYKVKYYKVDGLILPTLVAVSQYIGVSPTYVRKILFRAGGADKVTSFKVRDITVNINITSFNTKSK